MTHDYATITREVMDALGISPFKIAMICGTDARTVKNWLRGTVPLHPQGELLLSLHSVARSTTYGRPPICDPQNTHV